VNPGGEPERDDTGLPPVDIEIPDDARELDRDVQAYYRELRALRRHMRSVRLRGTLARDGIVLPLLACFLILALITGTLLSVFTATSGVGQNVPGTPGASRPAKGPGAAASATAAGSASPAARSKAAGSRAAGSRAAGSRAAGSRAAAHSLPSGAAPTAGSRSAGVRPTGSQSARSRLTGQRSTPAIVKASGGLPDAALQVGRKLVRLRQLSRAILVLIPARCGCGTTVARLASQAAGARAAAFLIEDERTAAEVHQFAAQLARRPGLHVDVAADPRGSLGSYPHRGLTAIMVGPNRSVAYATGLQPGDNLTALGQALGG
jgi:hypothetical protein